MTDTKKTGRAADLTGHLFGKLTVLERAPDHVTAGGARKTAWLCECDCGTQKIVLAHRLTSGRSTSCGCSMAREAHADPGYMALRQRLHRARGSAKNHLCACGQRARTWRLPLGADRLNLSAYVATCDDCANRIR